MKNDTYLLLFLFLMSGMSLTAQDCEFTAQYPSTTNSVGTNNLPIQIVSCSYAGEYSLSTGYETGKSYTFSSSEPSDYLTLRRADTNEALVSGMTPISYTYGFTDVNIETHVALSSACDTEEDCRDIVVTCQDCGSSCTNVTLTNQTEVNTFDCYEITGSLVINDDNDGIDDIVDLSPIYAYLNGPNASVYSVYVNNCDNLPNLTGLHGIETVEDFLNIGDNDGLIQLLGAETFAFDEIGGDLFISLNGGLLTINGFENVTNIGGQLYISSNTSVTDIGDWSLLETVNDDFSITDLPQLGSMPAFEALTSVDYLSIASLFGLPTIDGFHQLETINGGVFFNSNANLTSVSGFEQVNTVGGDFYLAGHAGLSECCWAWDMIDAATGTVTIQFNDTGCDSESVIEMACAVPDCATIDYPLDGETDLPISFTGSWTPPVTGGTVVEYDVRLGTDPTDLDFYATTLGTSILFIDLTEGTDYFWSVTPTNSNGDADDCAVFLFTTESDNICGSVSLTSQTDVNNFNCFQINGTLSIIDDNDGIDDIVDLSPIFNSLSGTGSSISGGIFIEQCNALTDLNGLHGLESLGGHFQVYQCSNLEHILLDEQFMFTSIGSMYIGSNPKLKDVDGFDAIEMVTIANLVIVFNSELTSISGFENVESINAALLIDGNSSLTEIPSFNALSSLSNLTLSGTELTTISGFNSLTELIGDLFISYNAELVSIDGFHNLHTIQNNLWVFVHDKLTSVNGFEMIDEVTDVNISSNYELTDCCWASPMLNAATGTVDIYANATGCDTEAEIMGTPPEIQFANNLTGYKVRVEWLPVINADKYRVQYRKLGDTDWILKSTTSLFNLLVNLEPNTFYDIRLASRVCGVWGDYGVMSGFETSGCVSPDKDYDQSNYGSNHKVVLLPVEDANKYQVKYQFVGGTGNGIIKNYPNGDLDRNLIGLQSSTEYTIETRTRCSSGEWTPFESKEGFETSSCVAPSPTQITYPELGEAMIEWDAQENGTNYQIRYRIAGNPNWTVKASTNPMKLLVDLEVGTNYLFQMRAKCPSWTAWSGNYSFSTPAPLDGESEITGRSVSAPALDLSFGLFPNPTDGNQITIDFELDFVRVEGVEVYDLYGNMVMSQAMDSEIALKEIVLTLDGNMIAGHYMMRVYFENESQVERFVIVK